MSSGPSPGAEARTGGGDGQPRGAQGRAGQGTDRRQRLRGVVLATLLTGPQPDRGSVLEGEGAVKASRSTNPRGLDRGDGESVGYGDYKGLPRVLRALRILASGPTSMTTAVRTREF